MPPRLVLASLHLLALGVGLAGAWARARALRDSLRDPEDRGALRRAYTGSAWWGIAATTWMVTGLWQLLAGTDKPTGFYLASHAFWLKMALVAGIATLEAWPAITLVRWRTGRTTPDPRDAGRIEVISYVECALLVVVVLASASMARGVGAPADATAPRARAQSAAPTAPTAPTAPRADSALAAQPFVAPSGSETVTADDIALLRREIAMPLAGIDPATLHSNFDERRGGGTRRHEALDIMAPRRTVIHSAAAGRILKLFTSVAGGLMVYAADSSERFVLLYAHLDGYAPGLRDGARLARGQPLGYVGSTGNASANAPHLHFAIARSADVKRWSRGQSIDPLPVLQAAAH